MGPRSSQVNRNDMPSAYPVREETDHAPWLVRQRVAVPDPVPGYIDRPSLEMRFTAQESGITLLHAPPGFGKTALLANCCRRLQSDGVSVAWLSIDENDSPQALAGYLALAFQNANLDTTSTRRTFGGPHDAPSSPGCETRSGYRISMLIRAIERHGAPCFLALDEIERLTNPDAVATLNQLVRAVPANLQIAMAFRIVPPGLDIATPLLDGAATVVQADDLRFTKAEISRYFDSKLSRSKLAAVAAESAGWPIALRICRNAGRLDGSAETVADAAGVWIESRLWRGLSAVDRDFVLDIALFDWFDPDLVDEATGALNSRRRLDVIGTLAGLIQTSAGSASAMRLHPFIRDHCANRRFAEDPDRFRDIHRAIARALARRGQILDALRHASEAGDAALIGSIALEAGGIRLWIQRGFGTLRKVDQYLTPETVAAHPRLALVRCLVLAISGNVAEAERVFTMLGPPADFRIQRDDPEDLALAVDRMLVNGMLGLMACSPPASSEIYAQWQRSLGSTRALPSIERGLFNCGSAVVANMRARFNEALDWCDRARGEMGRTMRYVSCHVDYQAGLACMALGRTREAAQWYRRGLDDMRKRRLGDNSTILFGEILAAELELERSGAPPGFRPPPPPVLGECGAWLDAYAAAIDVAMGLALHEHGVDGALEVVDGAREYAWRTGRVPLGRLCCALRVSLLVADGRPDEAERSWRAGDLPGDDTGCLDFDVLYWREVEAIASGRLAILIARGQHQQARTLATRLLDVATRRDMVRTSMRVLAMSVRLEADAADTARAMAHLSRFVALYETTSYARALARECDVAVPLLERVVRSRDDALAITAERLRKAIIEANAERPPADAPLTLTREERDILERIERQTDAEIARGMHLTYDALRYRVRGLFAKLDARSRHDAVHKARALGVLAPTDPSS